MSVSFYIITPPGFEEQTLEELKAIWPYLIQADAKLNQNKLDFKLDKGGIELNCEPILAYQLNFFLKTASRVLQRVAEFKAKDFPTLFNKIMKIPFENMLWSGEVRLHVSSSKSRLAIEKRIEETISEVLSKKKLSKAEKNQLHSTSETKYDLYVRIFEDIVTVSLDTTGEHLHKRGWATSKEEAPLRETIASFCIYRLINNHSLAELKNITIIDPMAGSGTFLLEALTLLLPNTYRKYSFQLFKNVPKLLNSETFVKNYKVDSRSLFKNYFGFDQSSKAVSSSKKNLQSVLSYIKQFDTSLKAQNKEQPVKMDFEVYKLGSGRLSGRSPEGNFDLRSVLLDQKIWCVLNPPYGERLELEETLLRNLLNYLSNELSAIRAGILLPNAQINQIIIPEGWQREENYYFKNGGIDVCLAIFSKNNN